MDTPLEAPLPPSFSNPPRRSLWRLIHDRNPFFLLSAVSMFVGFRIVLAAVNAMPGDLKHLLLLIITLNIYEGLLIALGLFLIVRRGSLRDGWILLTIEAIFLVDLTNLNAEFFSADPRFGSIVSGICFLLAMLKIFIIVRTLGLRLSAGTVLYIAAQLAFLLGLPGIFKLMTHQARVTPMQTYGVWWMAALLIVAGTFMVRRRTGNNNSPMALVPWWLYILVPLVSLIVHLAGENRVYWVHFNSANVAPILLAFVVAMNRPQWARFNPIVLGGSLALVAIALLMSLVPAENAGDLSGHLLGIAAAPLRLSLFGSVLVLAWLALAHHSWLALQASTLCAMLGCLGIDIPDMTTNASRGGKWTTDLFQRCIPETPLQWGYTAIGAAFLLLGVGAAISLKRRPVVVRPMEREVQ